MKSPAPALTRGLAILEFLAQSETPVGFNRIMEHFELPRATCARLLQVLRDEDWATRDESSGKYLPGPRWQRLGVQTSLRERLLAAGPDILKTLVSKTANTAAIFYWQSNQKKAVVLAKVLHPESVVMQEVGNVSTISACPWWMYFFDATEEAARAAWLAKDIPEPARLKTFMHAYTLHQDFIKTHPFSLDDGVTLPGVKRLAAPLHNAAGETIGAIGMAGTDGSLLRIGLDNVGAKLAEAARELSARIARG